MDYQENFYRGRVIQIIDQGGATQVEVQVLEGPLKGRHMTLDPADFKFKAEETVVLSHSVFEGEGQWILYEPYRLPQMGLLFTFFLLLVFVVSGKKGFGSLAGLAISLMILALGVIPLIVSGYSPIVVSLGGAFLIAITSLYLAHGFNRRTTIALLSTLAILALSAGMAAIGVYGVKLFGTGTEEAISLKLFNFQNLDLQGLLLGAILIGVLGVLDDITTAQTAVIHEIHHTDPSLGFKALYRKAIAVGHEHIASLINTLVIAYAGASLPVFLFLFKPAQPYWVVFNNEFLAEEIVRTIIGSATLVLAVPLSTVFAAYCYSRRAALR